MLTRFRRCATLAFALVAGFPLAAPAHAEVTASGDAGFQVQIDGHTNAGVQTVDHAIIQKIGQWWDGAHSYSGDASKMSIDLEERRFNETLPQGGFVTHLQVSAYQPGQQICMLGGLGPLQGMGLHGALTIAWRAEDGGTKIRLNYIVTGFSPEGLKSLAPIVDGVLADQMKRLCAYCDQQAAEAASTAGD